MNTRQEIIEGYGKKPKRKITDPNLTDYQIINHFTLAIESLKQPQIPNFPEHKPLNLKQFYFAQALNYIFQVKDSALRNLLAKAIDKDLSDRVH